MGNWLWKRLLTCLKADYGMNELINAHVKHYRKELDTGILPIEVSAVGWGGRILCEK